MAAKPFGKAAPRNFSKERIIDSSAPGQATWEISEKTQRELESLDKMTRSAEQQSGSLLLD